MKKFDNLKLEHQLCFALYAATNSITRAYRGALDQAGITYTQYLVLLVLWDKDNISVGNIARRLDLDSATLTPILKRLEAAGFISRSRSLQDERVVEIVLTALGKKLQHEIAHIQQGVQCQTGLSNDEFIHLRDALHELAESMAGNTEKKAAA